MNGKTNYSQKDLAFQTITDAIGGTNEEVAEAFTGMSEAEINGKLTEMFGTDGNDEELASLIYSTINE